MIAARPALSGRIRLLAQVVLQTDNQSILREFKTEAVR